MSPMTETKSKDSVERIVEMLNKHLILEKEHYTDGSCGLFSDNVYMTKSHSQRPYCFSNYQEDTDTCLECREKELCKSHSQTKVNECVEKVVRASGEVYANSNISPDDIPKVKVNASGIREDVSGSSPMPYTPYKTTKDIWLSREVLLGACESELFGKFQKDKLEFLDTKLFISKEDHEKEIQRLRTVFNKNLSHVMNVRNDEKHMRLLIIEMQEELSEK